jgi:MFS family permease
MTDPPPGVDPVGPSIGTFASPRVHNYRLYFFGQGLSIAGSWMQNIAIGWLVLQLTHSGVLLGAMTAARFVPIVLLAPWGGVISDRSDRRHLLIVTQTCAALLSFVLAALSLAGQVTLPVLLVIVLMLGLVNVFDGPSRQSLISQLVDRDRLANAIALNSIAMNASRIIGPGIGGVLIASLGTTPCFFVNAVSFAFVIASLLAMRIDELGPSTREARAPGQIRAGFRYVRTTPALLAPLVMVAVTGIFAWEFPVSLPLVTTSVFQAGAAAYGTVVACLGAGSIAGGLVAARRRDLTVRSLSVSALIWGILILTAAAAPTLPVLGERSTDAWPSHGAVVDGLAGEHGHRRTHRGRDSRAVRRPVRPRRRRRRGRSRRSSVPVRPWPRPVAAESTRRGASRRYGRSGRSGRAGEPDRGR